MPKVLMSEAHALNLVRLIAETWGYGRLMQFLSEEWRKKDPVGALSVGPCFGMLPKE